MYNTTKSNYQTMQTTKGDNKCLRKQGRNASINEDHFSNTLHPDKNTFSPQNKNNPAGIVYSQNCENFQKRQIA